MSANGYDVAAEAPIVNTYVPINFGELYRIGAAQKAAVDEAVEDLNTAVTTFGEFRSPSKIDTENYYKNSIGKFTDLIEAASSNPDLMKDAGFRAQLQSRINGLDYTALSMLKESADMQRAGLEYRAKMEAAGRYNRSWDRSDITNYDTLGTGKIFDDISPVMYMSANELSQKYFDDLKPGYLGTVWKDGAKYNVTGNNMEDLYSVASAHYNDLVNTPQGKEYYRQFLEQTGNADEAKNAFINMIAQSHIDRTRRPTYTIDPYWLQTIKYRDDNNPKADPTRLDFINTTISRTHSGNINDYLSQLKTTNPKEYENLNTENNKIQKQLEQKIQEVADAGKSYQKTGNAEDLIAYNSKMNELEELKYQSVAQINKSMLKNEFKRVSGFSPDTDSDNINDVDEYSESRYIGGVKSALNKLKGNIALKEQDAVLGGIGGKNREISDTDGGLNNSYYFTTSKDFVLPETVFQLMTDTKPRELKRPGGIFTADKDLLIKELVESGSIINVSFIPDNEIIKLDWDTPALSGKLRIPKEQLRNIIGTGVWGNRRGIGNVADNVFAPAGKLSVDASIEDFFGGRSVEQTGGTEYYEIDVFRKLPRISRNPEFYQRVDQEWQNSPDLGIGSASQAKESYHNSAKQTLGY